MKKVLLGGTLKGGLYQIEISKLEDGFKVSGSTSLYNAKNKTYYDGHVSLLSNAVKAFHFSDLCNKQSTDALNVTSPACVNDSFESCKTFNLWHSRLGHPSKRVLSNVLSQLNINEIVNFDFCSFCQYGKSHKLPFSFSEIHASSILELIYADVWGPAPIFSIKGYRYYICFVDDLTHFTWIFP